MALQHEEIIGRRQRPVAFWQVTTSQSGFNLCFIRGVLLFWQICARKQESHR